MTTSLSEYRSMVNDKLSAAKVKGFWPDAMKNDAINSAGARVANFKKWPVLNKALKTLTVYDKEYYEYPAKFKPGSIFRIMVDGVEYPMKDWEYFREIRDNETDDMISSQLGQQYFIYPAAEADDLELDVYGQLRWEKLVDDADEGILPEDFDESIVKLAFATLLRKERRQSEANNELTEVTGQNGILAVMYDQNMDSRPKGYIGRVKSSRFDS